MATITVVSPKTVFPGADSFFIQMTEKNSTTLAALRWVTTDSTPRWLAIATDPGTVAGTNMVAGVNATSGLVATDIQVYVPGTIVEANSNATGTDPIIGTAYEVVVSGNDHQVDQGATTTDIVIWLRISPRDAAGDTNVRGYVKFDPAVLTFTTGL